MQRINYHCVHFCHTVLWTSAFTILRNAGTICKRAKIARIGCNIISFQTTYVQLPEL